MDAGTARVITIRGIVGQIRWSYYNAAAVNGYTVSRSASGRWTLSGTVVMSDPFKLAQRPLVFVAPTKQGEWVWPIRQLTMQQGVLRAELEPPDGERI